MADSPVQLEQVRDRLTIALTEVRAAEEVLSSTLRKLDSGAARAAKVKVTADVTDAFTRLRHAHEELSRARELLESE